MDEKKDFIMPLGQKSSRLYPISIFGKPKNFNTAHYKLKITGLVDKETEFLYQDILSLPHVEKQFDIHCVDGWSYLGPVFEGIYPYKLLEVTKPKNDARFVLVKSIDGYTTNLSLEFLKSEKALLAFKMNGKEMSLENGYPLRLVVDGKYAYKDAKWVVEFELREFDKRGYWEEAGYSIEADVYKNQRRDF
jgi:DMSO/TMAO reductase YedYZ molybdopterin-dependent catalytic subunit